MDGCFLSLPCTALRCTPWLVLSSTFRPFPLSGFFPFSSLGLLCCSTYHTADCRLPLLWPFFSNLLALSVSSSPLSSPLPHKHKHKHLQPKPESARPIGKAFILSSFVHLIGHPARPTTLLPSSPLTCLDSASLHSPPDQTRPDPHRPVCLSLLSRLFVARL